MELQSNDKAIEVGFGHGKTIAKGSAQVESGLFAGIDISETMLSVARKYNKRMIGKGLVELKLASADSTPYQDNFFNKVLTVHTIYFWKDPSKSFNELYRVMKPGARLVVGFRFDTKAKQSFPPEVYTFYSEDEVSAMLEEACFSIRQRKSDINRKRSLYWIVVCKNA